MTSSQKAYKCFSITQAFLGSPLRFEPALGSPELDALIEAYVPGPASKQDKLSEITIEFYKYATVDLNTGSLVRTYNVCLPDLVTFEQSPTAQSSAFSPPLHTPSPGSSSANFTDSGYGTSSFTLTPPVRTRNSVSTASSRGAIKKSSKKERRNTALAIETQKIPGFSIMTKDGVDVTTSAGRGTKTKEQREHAHLMRIMKACNECKRKKVRCDPSHRRENTDMSRTSSASKSSTPPSASMKPSPPASQPPPSAETAQPSQFELDDFMNFDMNAINDFVLFPEGDASFWNPADIDMDVDFASLSQGNLDSQDISNSWISNLDLSVPDNAFTNGQFELMNTNLSSQSYFSQSDSSQQLDFLPFNGYSSSSSPEEYASYERGVDSGGYKLLLSQSRHPQLENANRQSGGSVYQSPVQLSQIPGIEPWSSDGLDPNISLGQTQSSVSPPANWSYVPSANVNASLGVPGAVQQALSSDTGVVSDSTYGVSRGDRESHMILSDSPSSPTLSDPGTASGYESGSSGSSTPTAIATGNYSDGLLQTCSLVIQSYNGIEKPSSQLRALVNDVRLLQTQLEYTSCSIEHADTIRSANEKLKELVSSVLQIPAFTSDSLALVDQAHLQVRYLIHFFSNANSSSAHLDETLVSTPRDGSDNNSSVLSSDRNTRLFTPLLEKHKERDAHSASLVTTRTSGSALGIIQNVGNATMELKPVTDPSTLGTAAFATPGDEAITSQLQVYSVSQSQSLQPITEMIQNSTGLQVIDGPNRDSLDLQSVVISTDPSLSTRHLEHILSSTLALPDTFVTSDRRSEEGLISRAPLQGVPVISSPEQGEPETPALSTTSPVLAVCVQRSGQLRSASTPDANARLRNCLFTALGLTFFTLAAVYTTLPLLSVVQLFKSSLYKEILSKSSTSTILDIIFKSSVALLSGVSSSSTSSFGASLRKKPFTTTANDLFSLPAPQTFINLFDILSS